MTGAAMKDARRSRRWTQARLARRLRVTQAYVSLLESGERPVPEALAVRVVGLLHLPPTDLPHRDSDRPFDAEGSLSALAALGCPRLEHLSSGASLNPAEALFRALRSPQVEARTFEALPWLARRYPSLDWEWLVANAKQHNLQNRLGFVVSVARDLAEQDGDTVTVAALDAQAAKLEAAVLREADDLGLPLTRTERRWLLEHRPPQAARWNVLSSLTADALAHA